MIAFAPAFITLSPRLARQKASCAAPALRSAGRPAGTVHGLGRCAGALAEQTCCACCACCARCTDDELGTDGVNLQQVLEESRRKDALPLW